MDGDTGASRPNIMLQPHKKPDGTYSAWAMIVYEETKGVGSGPPVVTVAADDSEESKDKDGSGDKKGADRYYPDRGKNVIYHSFDFTQPDLVSAGTILNSQARDAEGNLLYLKDKEGNDLLDWNGEKIPAYENARRPRLLVQSKKNALDAVGNGEEATVMVTLFKMGEEGKGRPSDIFMRRWVVVKDDKHPSNKGNPYRAENLAEGWQNISSITPTEKWINPDSQSENRVPEKVVRWVQAEDNLDDYSWEYAGDDARAHRGFIKGNFLAVAYDWTPNWAAARNGNDVYNLYLRRSFDGGATWTTDPNGEGVTHTQTFKTYEGSVPYETEESDVTAETDATDGDSGSSGSKEKEEITTFYGPGEFEPARNVSQITNNKETVIEPRLVGVPGTVMTDGTVLYPEDRQDTSSFWVTYGTHSNPGRNSEEEGRPLDLYYSHSTDFGETYYTVTKTINPEGNSEYAGQEVTRWDWLAKDTGQKQSEQAECQIRMVPDGSIFYAVWNDTGEDGSDVMFRRIMREGGFVEVVEVSAPPAGDIDTSKSSVEVSPPLTTGGTSTVTLTARDGDGNPVSGYQFAMDITVIDNRSSSDEIYKIDGVDYGAAIQGVNVSSVTDDNGVVTYEIVMPALIDTMDGISVQHTSSLDGGCIGSPVKYVKPSSGGSTGSGTKAPSKEEFEGTIITTESIVEQVNNTEKTNVVAVLDADKPQSALISSDVFALLGEKAKDLTIQSGKVDITLPPNVVDLQSYEAPGKDAWLMISIAELSESETPEKTEDAQEGDGEGLYKIGNSVFEFTVQIITSAENSQLTNFNEQVSISISLEGIGLSSFDPDTLGVYRYNEDTGNWDFIGGEYDPVTNTITCVTDHFSYYAVMKYVKTFGDIQNHWARAEIEKLVSRHIVKGMSKERFNPDGEITRAEFTALVVRALGLNGEADSALSFTDVKPQTWYYGAVSTAVEAGIVKGVSNDRFCPDEKITRQEIAVTLSRALDYAGKGRLLTEDEINNRLAGFADRHDISDFARLGTAAAVDRKIISGRTGSIIAPGSKASRAEAAVMLKRFLTCMQPTVY